MTMRLQTYTVESDGKPFPLAMLYAESAFPMNQSDVDEINASVVSFRRFRVLLGRYVSRRSDKPLHLRWQSYGWQVLECQTR